MAEDAAKVGEDHGANERSTEGSSTLIEQVSVFVCWTRCVCNLYASVSPSQLATAPLTCCTRGSLVAHHSCSP